MVYVFNNMYQHVRIVIYDKQKLYDGIRELFNNIGNDNFVAKDFHVQLIIDKLGDDEKFLLDEDQMEQLMHDDIEEISCTSDQILQYVHSCIRVETLMKIIAGENP